MNSDVVAVPISKKSELKKVMSKIDEVGSAVIYNPNKLSESELITERYIFNKKLSNVTDEDSVPILNIEKRNETTLISTMGKVGKGVVQNIASSYSSSKKSSSFFIPVDVQFTNYFNAKNIYLIHKKDFYDLEKSCGMGVIEAKIAQNRVYIVTSSKELYYTKLSNISWEKIDVSGVNSLTVDQDDSLYIASQLGLYFIKEGEDIDKIESCTYNGIVDEVGFVNNDLILNIERKVIKLFSFEDGTWNERSQFNCENQKRISLKGESNFFGGILAMFSNDQGKIDDIKFLTTPSLKILEHPKHIR